MFYIFIVSQGTACVNVRRRVVYFTLALLWSDPRRLEVLSDHLFPHIFDFLSSEDVDLREGTLKLLANIAASSLGKQILASNGAFDAAVGKLDRIAYESEEQRCINER